MASRRSKSSPAKSVKERKPWQFKPGQSGNPKGRPKGIKNKSSNGRRLLLQTIDAVLCEPEVQDAVADAVREILTARDKKGRLSPLMIAEFLRLNLTPLMAKNILQETADDGSARKGVRVKITLDSAVAPEDPAPDNGEGDGDRDQDAPQD